MRKLQQNTPQIITFINNISTSRR